jgi:hypothetical protein
MSRETPEWFRSMAHASADERAHDLFDILVAALRRSGAEVLGADFNTVLKAAAHSSARRHTLMEQVKPALVAAHAGGKPLLDAVVAEYEKLHASHKGPAGEALELMEE